jgi:DNA-directed RNA polymerase specialized sigma24 family protein
VASRSIRDRRLTGARIPASKKEAAILYFVDNLRATEVAKIVGISLDSARAIRDREHERIMKLRETVTREYERIWERNIEADYNRETKR